MFAQCIFCENIYAEKFPHFEKRKKDNNKLIPYVCSFCEKINKNITELQLYELEKEKIRRYQLILQLKKLENCDFVIEGVRQNEIRRKSTIRNANSERRVRVYGGWENISDEEKKAIKEFYENCPEGYHVDHFIPLCKGGKHRLGNLQYLTAHENLAKGAKLQNTGQNNENMVVAEIENFDDVFLVNNPGF
jgi:5-methylcytosine-specific restriction endonuclease McrA